MKLHEISLKKSLNKAYRLVKPKFRIRKYLINLDLKSLMRSIRKKRLWNLI